MKKRPTRSRKPPASPNEQKLEMVTSRASNTFAQIHQEMTKGMGLFKRACAGRKGAKSPMNMASEASRSVERAINLADALKRDLLTVPSLMNAILNEVMQPPTPPPAAPGGFSPRLLEV